MGRPEAARTRAATLLLLLAWLVLLLAMAVPVAERVLMQGYVGLPFMRQAFPGAIRPCLFGAGGVALVAAIVLLVRAPGGPPPCLVAVHTHVLRIGGILGLFGGSASLISAISTAGAGDTSDFIPYAAIADIQFLGAYLGGATGSLLLGAFLARRRGWGSALALTAAANLVLGFFVPSGTFLMVIWLMRIRPEEEPPPSG